MLAGLENNLSLVTGLLGSEVFLLELPVSQQGSCVCSSTSCVVECPVPQWELGGHGLHKSRYCLAAS